MYCQCDKPLFVGGRGPVQDIHKPGENRYLVNSMGAVAIEMIFKPPRMGKGELLIQIFLLGSSSK
jgi:hypothetical protein